MAHTNAQNENYEVKLALNGPGMTYEAQGNAVVRQQDATFDVELRGGKTVTAHFEIDNRNTEVMMAKFNTMWDRDGDPSKKFETRFKTEKNGARIDVEYPGRVVVFLIAIE